MGRLTTHVLDTALGQPAQNLRIELFQKEGGNLKKISQIRTNADGRSDAPLLEGTEFEIGIFQLNFHAGDYFDRSSVKLPEPKFLDEVIVRFGISDIEAHYHVPILLSPYGYSTYRGS